MIEPINSAEAAKLLKVTAETVCEWAREGNIPAFRLGRGWYFYADQLEQHVRAEAEKNIKCRSTNVQLHRITGVDSRSVVERFARAPAPRTGKKQKSTKPLFAVVTGGKPG